MGKFTDRTDRWTSRDKFPGDFLWIRAKRRLNLQVLKLGKMKEFDLTTKVLWRWSPVLGRLVMWTLATLTDNLCYNYFREIYWNFQGTHFLTRFHILFRLEHKPKRLYSGLSSFSKRKFQKPVIFQLFSPGIIWNRRIFEGFDTGYLVRFAQDMKQPLSPKSSSWLWKLEHVNT